MDLHQQLNRIKKLLGNNQLTLATAEALRLASVLPDEARWHSELGLVFNQLKHYDQAMGLFERAVQLAPDAADHHYNLATVQRFVGRIDQAQRSLQKALALNPQDHEAWHLLAQLNTQTLADNHIPQLRQALQQAQHPTAKVSLQFALAKELDDLGDYEASFQALQDGARLRRQHMDYQVEGDLQVMQAIAKAYPTERFAEPKGCMQPDPIFVIGMPRTGTTLVERMLSAHCQVHSCGEINNFALSMLAEVSAQGLSCQDRLSLIAQSAGLDFARVGQAYLDSLKPLRGTEPRVIDKLPFNYLYAGLIHLALPNAKIIEVRRNPMDTCFAVYKQLFQNAYPFSYQQDELAAYFIGYRQLMAHWHQVMPGVIYTLDYEELVQAPRAELQKLLAYCELDWQDECLAFEHNSQASTTASANQVRQPLYTSSLGKWRHYQRHLQPMLSRLQAAGIEPIL